MRPRLLDLYCKAGGASVGYFRAGFEVVGVDIKPQPHYPFEFYQGDALTYPLEGFDAYHASPPCQAWGTLRKLNVSRGVVTEYPKLIIPIRERLRTTGKPYVIENTLGAPLIEPAMLCGSSFGLLVRRHRLFETNFALLQLPCVHYNEVADKPALHRHQGNKSRVIGCYGHGRGKGDTVSLWSNAMGIDWMTRAELTQAIPPAYTEFIGKYMLSAVMSRCYNRST